MRSHKMQCNRIKLRKICSLLHTRGHFFAWVSRMHNKCNGSIDNRIGEDRGLWSGAPQSQNSEYLISIARIHMVRSNTLCNLKHSKRFEALNGIISSYWELCRESTIACADKTNCRHSIDEWPALTWVH